MSVVSPVAVLFDQPTVTQKVLRGQVDGLLEAFASVPDPRKARGVPGRSGWCGPRRRPGRSGGC